MNHELKRIPLSEAIELLYEHNPKIHDIEQLCNSLRRYGIQELPKVDKNLGAIVAGNGRIRALAKLKKMEEAPPRGVEVSENGEWLIPILFGVDLEDEKEAQSYLLDSNSLSLAGFTPEEIAKLFDDSYVGLLQDLENLPVSVSSEDLENLLTENGKDDDKLQGVEDDEDEDDEDEDDDDLPESPIRTLQLFLDKETHASFMEKIECLMLHYQSDNLTDCTIKAVEEAYNAID